MPRKRTPSRAEWQHAVNDYTALEMLLRNRPPAPTPTLLADQQLALLAVGRFREALQAHVATLPGDPFAEPQPKAKRPRKAGLPSPAASFDLDAAAAAEQEPVQ